MATLTLNVDARQAEAILKNLKGTMEGAGRAAGNLDQRVQNLQDDLSRAFKAPNLAKLQGNLKGLSKDLQLVKTVSATTNESMARLVTTLRWTGVEYEKFTSQSYKKVIATEAEMAVTKMLDAQYAKHATIVAEITMLEKGYAATMSKAIAADEAKLAIAKVKNAQYIKEAQQIRLLTVLRSNLNLVEKQGALAHLGIQPIKMYNAGPVQKFTEASKSATISTKNLHGAVRGLAGGMGQLWMAYGNLLPLLAGFAGGAAVVGVIKAGSSFEYMAKYIETINNSTQSASVSMGQLKEELLGIAGVSHTPVELAEGIKELVKAGFPAADALKEIEQLSKFATIAEIDLADATKVAVTQFRAWGASEMKPDGLKDMTQAANAIAKVALSTKTTIQDLGVSLSYTTELASLSGVSFYELVGSLGALANKGIEGSKSGQALRTSLLRLQNPASKANKMLEKFGVNFKAFKPSGEFKGLITMFEELETATAKLTDQQRSALMKELFGLRSGKAGANIAAMVSEVKKFSVEAKKAAEEGKFIEEAYANIADSVKIKFQELKAELTKTFIKSFNAEQFKGVMDSLKDTVSSQSFISGLQSVAKGVFFIVSAITTLIRALGELKTIGIDLADIGLVATIVFGGPIGAGVAGTLLGIKKVSEAVQTLKELSKDNTPTAMQSTLGMEAKSVLPVKLLVDTTELDKLPTTISRTKKEMMPDLESIQDAINDVVSGRVTDNTTTTWVERYKEVIHKNLNSVIEEFDKLSDSMKDFGKEAKSLWDDVNRSTELSIDDQLQQIKALEYGWSNPRLKKPRNETRMSSGLLIDGKEQIMVYQEWESKAGKFYRNLGDMAYTASQRQKDALNAYVTFFEDKFVNTFGSVSTKMGTIFDEISATMSSGFASDEIVSQLGDKLKEAAEKGQKAFKEMSEEVGKAIDNIAKKEKDLLNEIKGYAKDTASSHESAGKARFDILQKYSTEARKYYNIVDRINALNKKAKQFGEIAGKLTGAERKDMYDQAKKALQEALGLAGQLSSTEENGVTKAKAKKDALAAINEYEKRSVKLASQMKSKAEEELSALEESKKKLEDIKTVAEGLVELFGKAINVDLQAEDALKQLKELKKNIEDLVKQDWNIDVNVNNINSSGGTNKTNNLSNPITQQVINSGSSTNGQVVNVNFTMPGSDTPIPAQMTQNDASELMNQLAKANRLSS